MLSQQSYFKKMLYNFGMWDCNKKHNTPINTHIKLQKAEAKYKPKTANIKWYQSAVGSLMYTMLETHSDIAYAVSVVS